MSLRNASDFNELIVSRLEAISEDVSKLLEDVGTYKANTSAILTRMADHEIRIREAERQLNRSGGVLGFVKWAISAIGLGGLATFIFEKFMSH